MDNELSCALGDIQRFFQYILHFMESECKSFIDTTANKDLIVYYTATNPMGNKYIEHWKQVDKDATLKYYSFNSCLMMIHKDFNSKVLKRFVDTPCGPEKVTLFKLSTMYMKPGLVVDPNVVPNISPDVLKEDNISSYIVVSDMKKSVNMIMMANTSYRRSNLYLSLFLSFLIAEEQNEQFDLYSTLVYNIGTHYLKSDEIYVLNTVKYKVVIGSSEVNKKNVDLVWFPHDEICQVKPRFHLDSKRFLFHIRDSRLYVWSKNGLPWTDELVVDIVFWANETLYTLSEKVNHCEYQVKKGDLVLLHREC